MIEFFIVDCGLLALALLAISLFRNASLVNRCGHFLIIGAMASGLVFTIQTFLLSAPLDIHMFYHSSLGNVSLRFDKLSLFFLGIIQLGGIVSSYYGIGYLSQYEKHRSLKSTLAATVILFFSMQILVAANHAFLFLVAWELMALSGYVGIILEREKDEVQHGSFIFFAATHIGTLFLYLMFLLLHQQTNSWELSVFAHQSYLPSIINTIFWFGFIGFGMKAGFMPFHFWLPEAHPVAPSHISAVLSAVMLKTGVYGLLRVILWTHAAGYLLPSLLLAISSLTAIFGIWNALAQKDLKRMLAYSSIENIGIIGIALSLMIFGMQNNQPLLTFLGLSGALFHTVNHFVFKSLLFMSAGTIYHHYHHRNIEQMGGLIQSAPILGSIMLIGSIAIGGLPPLNGFASEFIIYSGIFEASRALHAYFPFFMLIIAVVLAFAGGLALVGFTKVLSMIFLGSPKTTSQKEFHISHYELTSLSFLTMTIIVLGIFPQSLIRVTEIVFHEMFPSSQLIPWNSSVSTIQIVGIISTTLILSIAIFMRVKTKFVARRTTRTSVSWGCGYNNMSPRMQYSGTSFSDDVVHIAGKALNIEKVIHLPNNPLPLQGSFSTRAADFMLNKIIAPAGEALSWIVDRFKWLQSGKIQVYIAFSIIIVVFYVFLAFKM
jgi:formate hydrogenlyase subunit 3/multisubunit Na+/H+ antiporter MnhD subunit